MLAVPEVEDDVCVRVSKPLLEVYNAILRGTPRNVVAHGGRASGKTFTICMAIAARCALKPTFVLMLRATQASIRESSKLEFETAIQHLGLEGWTFGQYETTHVNGSRVVYRGLLPHTAHSIRSLAHIDIAWCDEAQYIQQAALRDLLPTIRDEGSQIIFSLNPLDDEGPVYGDFVKNPIYPDATLSIQANFDTNEWLTDDLKAQIAADRERDYDRYRHEWEGKPLLLTAAQVFRYQRDWWIEDLDTEVPYNAVPRFGLDIGMGNHPSVILKVWHWPGHLYIARENVDDALHQDSLAAFVGEVGVGPGDVVWSDRQTLPWHHTPDGWSIRHVPKQVGGENAGVKWMKSATHKMFVHPSCELTRYQFPRYSLKIDKVTGAILGEYDDHDDDTPDCVRYAMHEIIYGMQRQKKLLGGYSPNVRAA